MADLPDILTAIQDRPDVESRWLALAAWLHALGRDDEAVTVRVFWPTIRDMVERGAPLRQALRTVARNAAQLGRRARQIEARLSAADDSTEEASHGGPSDRG